MGKDKSINSAFMSRFVRGVIFKGRETTTRAYRLCPTGAHFQSCLYSLCLEPSWWGERVPCVDSLLVGAQVRNGFAIGHRHTSQAQRRGGAVKLSETSRNSPC